VNRPEQLPPTVKVSFEDTVATYTRNRLIQHTWDSYAGLPLSKFPEDLRVYEHLLWISEADAVIELGVQHGGSSLWFRDRLSAFSRYRRSSTARVIGVDTDLASARERLEAADPGYAAEITLVEGDVTDPSLPELVARELPPGARCLVVEDTRHEYETTLAALRGFSRFVAPGGFFVVEDGIVDLEPLRIAESLPRGVLPALEAWLESEGDGFTTRPDLELYGVTCHPRGFLQRVR
jgi:cephalosporin hydroxylase